MLEEDIDANCKCGVNNGIHLHHYLTIFMVVTLIGIAGSITRAQPELLFKGVAVGAAVCLGLIVLYMWFGSGGV